MAIFAIDENIRSARTLASEFYTNDEYFERSKDAIFARTWQFAAGPETSNTLTPFNLLPGFLDEPLLIRKRSDELLCLSNVCTHRGKVLVEEPCNAELIRCGYHGRRFSLDGKFLSMPEFTGVEDFPSAEDDLSKIAVETLGNFGFVSLSPTMSLSEYLGDAAGCFDDLFSASVSFHSSQDYKVNAHWALYCENYLEGFHIPYVHKGLNEMIDYGTYTTETFRHCSIQTGYDGDGETAGKYLFIFPNLMFNFYPWGISVNIVEPLTKMHTRVRFLKYVFGGRAAFDGAGDDLHTVEMEDEKVVESVQKGIRSRFYKHGRYSPSREQGTHHFHRLIAEFMR